MGNIKDSNRFKRLDSQIWKKSKVDSKGRTVLPKKIRKKLVLDTGDSILWISVHRGKQDNLFIIELGVKKQ